MQSSEKVQEELTTITLKIENYQHIYTQVATRPCSVIYNTCKFFGEDLGETEKILVTDDAILPVNAEFEINIDTTSPTKNLESFESPITLNFFLDNAPEEITFNIETENVRPVLESPSDRSALTFYEAIVDKKVELVVTPKRKGKTKKDKENKKRNTSLKKSKSDSPKTEKKDKSDSPKTEKKDKSDSPKTEKKVSSSPLQTGPRKFGSCLIDLAPFIFGRKQHKELIPIDLFNIYSDERLVTYQNVPSVQVTIEINKPFEFECIPIMLSLSIESIFNIPQCMTEDLKYQIYVNLPDINMPKTPIIFEDSQYKQYPVIDEYKKWHNMQEQDVINKSSYMIKSDPEDVHNKLNINLEEIYNSYSPRIEFNTIKRNILLSDGLGSFTDQIKKYRTVAMEVYCTKSMQLSKGKDGGKGKNKEKQKRKDDKGGGKKKQSPKAKNQEKGKETKSKDSDNCLHFMCIVDLSTLLYPGITRTRMAVPLTTYHELEANKLSGYGVSYFAPPLESPTTTASPKSKKKNSPKSPKSPKSSKSDKKSGKGSKKSSKGKKDANKTQTELPPGPIVTPEPEPSTQIYNEDQQPTFIIVEFELSLPIERSKRIEDLNKELNEIIHIKQPVARAVIDTKLNEIMFKTIISNVVQEINIKYNQYTWEKKRCTCDNKADFITYLRRTGSYQNLIYSIMEAASIILQTPDFSHFIQQDIILNQQLAGMIFIYLINQINATIKLDQIKKISIKDQRPPPDFILMYAREATSQSNELLAERYYLEYINLEENNSDGWLNYALYLFEKDEPDRATVCLQESLSIAPHNKNSLILNGILLTKNKAYKSAETCFLSVVVEDPYFVEAWGVLYLFYKIIEKPEGVEICKVKAETYISHPVQDNEILNNDDLPWTTAILPNTIFLRVASFLIKLRMFDWAEDALALEYTHSGLVHYLLAVICLYQKVYNHALEHLKQAKILYGVDYAVLSLIGHCYYYKDDTEMAEKYYEYVLELEKRPQNLHLVHINYAELLAMRKNYQEARKIMLLACKHHPSPYTWLCCGQYYYRLGDFISAEECFSESVMYDNRLPEGWAYLALTNLKICHGDEAAICNTFAKKTNLQNKKLIEEMETEFDEFLKKLNS